MDSHSIKPLMLAPDGTWSGPDVAISALPGKDHSQHVQHIGTLYPHFSVRARDWRYSLTSDGQEELYHYSSDPYEFTNLADDPEFAEVKSKLRAKLIALRDGGHWKHHDSLPVEELSAFELIAEVRGTSAFSLGDTVIAEFDSTNWDSVRIRVAGNRSQVWLNNRVFSDQVRDGGIAAGVIRASKSELRNIRIRQL